MTTPSEPNAADDPIETDTNAGTGPAHVTSRPDAGASPVDAANAVNPSGGPGIEVDPPDDEDPPQRS